MFFFFFFNDTATTEIYTLSLHDALPIFGGEQQGVVLAHHAVDGVRGVGPVDERSEEHTSELQSRQYLVCRLLLEKKKNKIIQKANGQQYATSEKQTASRAKNGAHTHMTP